MARKSAPVVREARRVIRMEAEAVRALEQRIGPAFVAAVETLRDCKGSVVVTGIGKSGSIGRKIMATLASTGTPAFFLHAAEAQHGDLGMVTRDDAILAVSYSGETSELTALLPAFRRLGVPLISITGHPKSVLARQSDIVLNVHVPREACPMNLAPTASTTATLAMGDALAVALFKTRRFTPRDFAAIHPSGSLGRKLLTRVSDLMHTGDAVPKVRAETPLGDAIVEMTGKRLGFTAVVDGSGRVIGVITDGDLRRNLQRSGPSGRDLLSRTAAEICTRLPKTIPADALATKALAIMEKNVITSLLVLDARRHPVGCVHIHDILKAGIA